MLLNLFLKENNDVLSGFTLTSSLVSLITFSVTTVITSLSVDVVVIIGFDCLNLNVFLGLEKIEAFLGSSSTTGFSVVVVDVVEVVVDETATGSDDEITGMTGLELATASPASPMVGNKLLNKSSASFPDKAISGSDLASGTAMGARVSDTGFCGDETGSTAGLLSATVVPGFKNPAG